MARIPKKIICLATAAVILCAHVPIAHAEALPNVLSGPSTVADIVMSYYAMSGAAVANTDWINTLYDSLGTNFGTIQSFAENGYLVTNPDGTWYATQAFEQAIENAPAYQSLGLDQIFNVSAQEAAAGGGLAASTGAATLAGATGAVGSVGVLPLLGGVTAAYWGGIAIGTLINHLIGAYGKNIEQAVPMDVLLSDIPNGSSCIVFGQGGLSARVFYAQNCKIICDSESTLYFSGNPNQTVTLTKKYSNYPNPDNYNYSLNSNGRYIGGTTGGNSNYSYVYPMPWSVSNLTVPQYNQFKIDFLNGAIDIPQRMSPDLIGPQGNQEGDYDPDSGKYQVPNMLPQVDPSVQSGQPLTLDDWLRFANSAKGNNSDPDGKTKNKKLFDDIMDAIKKGVPSTPDPDPDPDPDPYHPPTPTPVPDPDYGDPNPDQPDFESETDIPDPVDTGNPWVTPDLLDKFPFCIPKDMIDVVKGFKSADRTAPHISWNFKSPVGHVDYTFNLDLEDFEDLATLLRALELAVFIVGLAFSTRYLIGAS